MGYTFFYWEHFKTNTKKKFGEILDGYSPAELFVTPHFQSLKQEILESGYVSFKQWNEKIVFKADEFYKTNKVKEMSCKEIRWGMDHGIKQYELILVSHLQCIIIYCDWSELCTLFSSTFRKRHEFEPLELLKKRHSKFHYFGKGLVEAVLDFGICGGSYEIQYSDGEGGPFYSGVSLVMNIGSFSIYLKGPCSTSKDIEIAMNFAKRDGIIISFQNDVFFEGAYQRLFDCSWISHYTDENERLFISGYRRLRIETIRIIESGNNYKNFVHAFNVFDQMISGVDRDEYDEMGITATDSKILDEMINNKLRIKREKDKVIDDKYIIDTFDLFLNSKTQIKIKLEDLDKYYKEINHLIMHSLVDEGIDWRGYNVREERKINNNSDIDLVNVLNAKMLVIFPNLNEIEIYTTYGSDIYYPGYPLYRFSLSSFLSSIQSSKSSIKYIINANREWSGEEETDKTQYPEASWLNNIVTPSIEKAFNSKNWTITQSVDTDWRGQINACDILTIHQ
eukprot:160612_1